RFGQTKETPESLNVVARALAEPETAARDVAALRAFKEVLRGLVLAEAVITTPLSRFGETGEGPGVRADWNYETFLGALREGVEAASYDTPLSRFAETGRPEGGLGVTVASVLDARGLSFRAVAILGLAEGEFPQAEREMPLLRESDRDDLRARGLPLESRLRGDEVTIFYEAITRARERLLLCRPYLADDGQGWEPSAYWRQVMSLISEPQIIKARPEDRLPPDQVASMSEWIEQGYDREAVARGVTALNARLAAEAAGPHEGHLAELSLSLVTRYPPTQSWSASRLEAYGTCGFYFYVAHVLKLEPRAEPEEGYDASSLGNMYHAILERLYRDAPGPTDLEALLARLPEIAREVFTTAPSDYGFRPTAIWDQQQSELIRILSETVTALAEKSEGWTPRHFEQRFGFGAPPLVVCTDEGEVRVHGYIDRIDVAADGRLRVVDYKASGSPITARDLKDGHRLQLPLYALAVRDALGLGEVAEGFYWHIGQAKESSLKLEKFEGGVPGAFETVTHHLATHVAGIRAGQFQPEPPDGGCPGYCPAVGFCWRYRPRGF
ncbi:MAG: exodeoxyribonuclease V subunit gamma, partial [Chloroflexi bacterium]|nr:exodeoxyribonuclease V subunit gamma [Chloroflexota bacterium]